MPVEVSKYGPFQVVSLPAGTTNVAYNQLIAASGGTGNISLVVSNVQNAIAGLTVPGSGTNSLAITGTPTATGTETPAGTAAAIVLGAGVGGAADLAGDSEPDW